MPGRLTGSAVPVQMNENLIHISRNDIFARDSKNEKALVTLSVRSAFDLYFQAKKFPPGSEVLMTGVNIPDMVRIIEEHGCVPVPVDLDLDTM